MSPWMRSVGVLLFWLAVGLVNTGQTYLAMVANGEASQFETGNMVAYNLAVWSFWAPVTWVLLKLAGWIPLPGSTTRPGRMGLAVFGVLGLAVVPLSGVYQAVAVKVIFGESNPLGEFVRIFLTRALQFNVFIYLAILAAVAAWAYSRRLRERDRVATELRAELAQARLTALEMQLHPHFLFNTLQNVASLVRRDPEQAARTVARLGDLLRLTLDKAGTPEVTLAEELRFLDLYLEIERTRFPDRLRVKVEVPPELTRARVPSLVLQPLVENALQHAVAPRANGGTVTIRARDMDGTLAITVSDDGPGLSSNGATGTPGRGIGLANTRKRLTTMYGEDSLKLIEPPQGGLEAQITLPLSLDRQ